MANKGEASERNIAGVLEDALAALRASARTDDFFSGYTLSEVVEEELAAIGSEDGGSNELTPNGRRTRFAEIAYIKTTTESAVEAAKELDGSVVGDESEDDPDDLSDDTAPPSVY
jgi:hypothetical protein